MALTGFLLLARSPQGGKVLFDRQKGGGGVMLWAAMSYYGLSRLVAIHATLTQGGIAGY